MKGGGSVQKTQCLKIRTQKLVSSVLLLVLFLGCIPLLGASAAEQAIVWVATSGKGKRYHYEDCRTLKKGKRSLTLSAAKAKGYTACGVCNP